jgi:hypothetical protein
MVETLVVTLIAAQADALCGAACSARPRPEAAGPDI